MKKIVNGKIVDIKNMELFEKAAEGAVLAKIATSSIADKITVESEIINECLKHYEVIYKAMPFPLYCIESNIKHATVAAFIKDCMDKPLHMWVDEALFICVDRESSLAIKIVGSTWGVIKTNCEKEDNTSIENYRDEVGYREYEWLLRKIMLRENTGSFYTEFMPDFVKACSGQDMLLRWELANILTFGNLPEKLALKDDRILNLENKSEFILDIYSGGSKKSGESEYTLSLIGNENEIKLKPKYVKTYKFDLYEKKYFGGNEVAKPEEGKLQKNNIIGLSNLFNTLCSMKIAFENNEFEGFSGFIADRDLVYAINGRLFICKAFKASETKEIARGVELYSYDRGLIYFIKPTHMGKGIKKEMIYSYSLKDANLRLCKIQFVV